MTPSFLGYSATRAAPRRTRSARCAALPHADGLEQRLQHEPAATDAWCYCRCQDRVGVRQNLIGLPSARKYIYREPTPCRHVLLLNAATQSSASSRRSAPCAAAPKGRGSRTSPPLSHTGARCSKAQGGEGALLQGAELWRRYLRPPLAPRAAELLRVASPADAHVRTARLTISSPAARACRARSRPRARSTRTRARRSSCASSARRR